MFSPLILRRTLKLLVTLESIFIFLFPLALVTSITLTGILIYLSVFIFAALWILGEKQEFYLKLKEIPWHVIAFLIYIFAFSFTKVINSGFTEGYQTFFRTCQDYFVFLWVLFFMYKGKNNQELIKYSILIASIITISYGILQFFNLDIFHRQINPDRISGFHKNPYSYAGQLIVFFFFILNKFDDDYKNLSVGLLLVSCFFCIINASERAVVIGILIGLAFYYCFKLIKNKKFNKTYLFRLILIISIPVILTILLNKKVIKRVFNTFVPLKERKPNLRFKIWGIALAIWKRNILFGAGKFPTIYHQINDSLSFQVLSHAHNVYLQILVTNGIIGLFAFLNLFVSIIKILFDHLKTSKYALCLISIIFTYAVEGIFEYFWGDSEVRYLLLYFIGFVFGTLPNLGIRAVWLKK